MTDDNDLIRRGDVIAALTDLPIFNVIDSDETNARAVSMIHKAHQAIRALAASQPDPVTNAGCRQQVKVRPLEWRRDNLKGSYPARFRAEMPCKSGDYTLAGSERENLWQWFRNGYFAVGHQMHKPMPLEAAKAAAQADYEGRVLAALEPAPHVNETPKSEHDSADVLAAMRAALAAANASAERAEAALAALEPAPVTLAEALNVLLSNRAAIAAMVDAAEEAHEKGVSFGVVVGRALRAVGRDEANG